MSSRSKASSYASGSERKPNNGLGSVSNLRNLLICDWSGWVELNLHLYISGRGGSKRWILTTQALFPIARCLIESGGGFQMDSECQTLLTIKLITRLVQRWAPNLDGFRVIRSITYLGASKLVEWTIQASFGSGMPNR